MQLWKYIRVYVCTEYTYLSYIKRMLIEQWEWLVKQILFFFLLFFYRLFISDLIWSSSVIVSSSSCISSLSSFCLFFPMSYYAKRTARSFFFFNLFSLFFEVTQCWPWKLITHWWKFARIIVELFFLFLLLHSIAFFFSFLSTSTKMRILLKSFMYVCMYLYTIYVFKKGT